MDVGTVAFFASYVDCGRCRQYKRFKYRLAIIAFEFINRHLDFLVY